MLTLLLPLGLSQAVELELLQSMVFRGASGATAAVVEGMGMASDFYSNWREMNAQFEERKAAVDGSDGLATLKVAGDKAQGRDMRIVRMRGPGCRWRVNISQMSVAGQRVFIRVNFKGEEQLAPEGGDVAHAVSAKGGLLAGCEYQQARPGPSSAEQLSANSSCLRIVSEGATCYRVI